MAHAVATHTDDSEAVHRRGYRWFYRWLAYALLFMLICGVSLTCWIFVRRAHYQHQFDMAVVRIRVTGEPLDGAELNAYYHIPAGETDLTPIYLRALAATEIAAQDKDAATLPIIGSGADIPPVGKPWPDLERVKTYLERHKRALDLLHECAMQRGVVRYPFDATKGFDAITLDEIQQARAAARLISLEFHVHVREGNSRAAADTIIAQLRLCETLRQYPTLISQLAHIALFGMAVANSQELLDQHQASDKELPRLQEVLSEADFGECFYTTLLGERAIVYQNMVSAIQQSPQSQGVPASPIAGMLAGGQSMAASRPGDCAKTLELYTDMVELSALPFPRAFQESQQVATRLKQFLLDDQKQLPWNRNIITSLSIPSQLPIINGFTLAISKQRSCVVSIAIERYRLQHNGTLPAKLADLVPDFLAEVPLDPYNGQPLQVAITNADYSVYSVGPDFKDDSGDVNWDSSTAKQPADQGVRVKTGE